MSRRAHGKLDYTWNGSLRKVKFALFSWVFSWLFSLTIEREMGLESQRGTKGTLLRKEKG